MRRILAPIALSFLGACSSGNGDFNHDLVFTMSLTVPASAELHNCQYVQIPEGADINVTGFAHEYTPGSHHFLLYNTTLTAIPAGMTGQYDCTTGNEPIMKDVNGIVYGGQVPSGAWSFPDGVAATLPAGRVLIMNTHYLNTTGAPLDTTVKVGLDTTSADKVKTQGGFFVFYDPFIDLPAQAKATSGIRCAVPADVTVVNAFSHYHFRGTDMKVFEDSAGAARATDAFYTTTDWEHPQNFDGPMTWKSGDWIRFQCDYNNMDSVEVFQGPNAQTSEMCVLAGLYYPKQAQSDFEFCANESISGFGTKTCLDTAQCLSACPASDAPVHTSTGALVGPCWERCVAAACDGAMDPVFPLLACATSKCATECASGGTSCLQCTATNCATQLDTCSSQTCQ
jgi:hypothetical protein